MQPMNIIRHWPLPILAWLIFTVSLVAIGVVSLIRSRLGTFVHWPYWLGGALLVIGLGLVSTWAYRPHFLTSTTPPAKVSNVDEFEQHIHRLIDSGGTPGVAAIVVRDGSVAYEAGIGDGDATGTPMTVDSVFRWWSVTKMFTAVAVLQLAEQGDLGLDDPVSDHLDFFEIGTDDGPPVTIRHLLSHSSGLGDAGSEILGWIHFEDDPARNQTELTREKLPHFSNLKSEPGIDGRYTNVGYMVLSAVIEQVSGTSYERFVTERILEPLGMSQSGFAYVDDMGSTANGSHPVDVMTIMASMVIDLERAVQTRSGGVDWFNAVYPDQTAPSGLIGTPRDMAKFVTAMLNGGELDGVSILTAESVALMNTRQVEIVESPAPVDGLGFGLGWFHDRGDGRASLTHGGQGVGTASMIRIYPDEDLGVIVVSNSTYLGSRFGLDEIEALADIDW